MIASEQRRASRALVGTMGITLPGGMTLMTARAQEADEKPSQKMPPPADKITPRAAVKIATWKAPGRALSANFEYDEGHRVYGVFVVSEHIVRSVPMI